MRDNETVGQSPWPKTTISIWQETDGPTLLCAIPAEQVNSVSFKTCFLSSATIRAPHDSNLSLWSASLRWSQIFTRSLTSVSSWMNTKLTNTYYTRTNHSNITNPKTTQNTNSLVVIENKSSPTLCMLLISNIFYCESVTPLFGFFLLTAPPMDSHMHLKWKY